MHVTCSLVPFKHYRANRLVPSLRIFQIAGVASELQLFRKQLLLGWRLILMGVEVLAEVLCPFRDPRTPEGIERIRLAATKHEFYSKPALAECKRDSASF